ncbi:uncharacterized protein LOC143508585 [Brachyhypopomus gauderio]|uniref:uncharacterized protein LOC143508585 n=1 Tax=Brachyhypopomus gauderio TaxID=698409 RepID=UPI004041E122
MTDFRGALFTCLRRVRAACRILKCLGRDPSGALFTCLRRVRAACRILKCLGRDPSENCDLKLSVEETCPHQSSVRPWAFPNRQDDRTSIPSSEQPPQRTQHRHSGGVTPD